MIKFIIVMGFGKRAVHGVMALPLTKKIFLYVSTEMVIYKC